MAEALALARDGVEGWCLMEHLHTMWGPSTSLIQTSRGAFAAHNRCIHHQALSDTTSSDQVPTSLSCPRKYPWRLCRHFEIASCRRKPNMAIEREGSSTSPAWSTSLLKCFPVLKSKTSLICQPKLCIFSPRPASGSHFALVSTWYFTAPSALAHAIASVFSGPGHISWRSI